MYLTHQNTFVSVILLSILKLKLLINDMKDKNLGLTACFFVLIVNVSNINYDNCFLILYITPNLYHCGA